jgi:hypothetical protein
MDQEWKGQDEAGGAWCYAHGIPSLRGTLGSNLI